MDAEKGEIDAEKGEGILTANARVRYARNEKRAGADEGRGGMG